MSRSTKSVWLIVREYTAPLYRMLGIGNIVMVSGPEEAINRVSELLSRSDIGLIGIEEDLAMEIGLEKVFSLSEELYPLITVIPGARRGPSDVLPKYYKSFTSRTLGFGVSE